VIKSVQHQSDSKLFPKHKMVFSPVTSVKKHLGALRLEIFNSVSAAHERELEQRESLVVLCNACRQKLELFPFRK
jgi:hypothetical protein